MVNSSHARRVLVVDDEFLIRWALREALEARGYLVAEASDAASARQAMNDHASTPDAIILDYRLPDSNDLALLTSIRRSAPSAPVIMMTAHGSPEMMHEALALGAHTVVSKPFEVQQIVDLVGAALGTH
jgi:DNA-binding NtrC family response regulator